MKNKRNLDKTQQNKTMNDIISTLPDPLNKFANQKQFRSEERREGKECRFRWSPNN